MSDRKTAFRNKISIAACVALAVVMVSAADMYTGFRERTEVNVAEGTTLQHAGLMLQSAESAVNKTNDLKADVPDIAEDTAIEIADGAKLRLDFPGTLKLDNLKYNGRSYSGILTVDNCPCLLGPGALDITPKGTVILFR